MANSKTKTERGRIACVSRIRQCVHATCEFKRGYRSDDEKSHGRRRKRYRILRKEPYSNRAQFQVRIVTTREI